MRGWVIILAAGIVDVGANEGQVVADAGQRWGFLAAQASGLGDPISDIWPAMENNTGNSTDTTPGLTSRELWREIVSAILIVAAGVGVQYMPENFKTPQVVIAVITGVITGQLCTGLTAEALAADPFAQIFFLPGSLWLQALKALVLPLIIFAMIESMVMLRSLPGAKNVGFTVIGLYTLTTVMAAIEGCVFAYAILTSTITGDTPPTLPPGVEPPELADRSVLQTVLGLFKNLVPTNFVADAAANNYLPLICAALAFGAIVKAKKNEDSDEKSTALQVIEDSNAVVIGLVHKIMQFTPYGVGSLVFQALTKNDITQAADELFWLAIATISGLAFHAFLVYPSLLLFAAGQNPLKYIGNIVPSILTAMGTSSSAATLPVSIQMAKEKNGIADHIADFVLSLGATINMDGTGLYLICATYFLARMQAATFELEQFLLLAVLATVTSAGSAPVPSASLVLLATIVDAVGLEYNESHFGLILMIDWLLDRMRTMVNVIGDATVTAVVHKRYGTEMPEIEMSKETLRDFSAVVKTLSGKQSMYSEIPH